MLNEIAYRAGLNCERCTAVLNSKAVSCKDHAMCGEWELHRFRKTFACWQHERNKVSVNTLREWLGHESLDVTLDYLPREKAETSALGTPTPYLCLHLGR